MGRQAKMAAFVFGLALLLPLAHSATFTDAQNALLAMSPTIKSAQSSLDALGSKLADANRYLASTSAYSASYDSAQGLLSQARAAEHSASSEFATADYDGVVRDAAIAQNYAAQAKTAADTATNALNSVLTAPLDYEIAADQPSLRLADGTSTTVLIRLASRDNRKLDCSYRTSQTPLQKIGTIPPSGTQSFPAVVQAPPSGNGTMQFLVHVSCSAGSYMSGERQAAIEVQYQPDPVRLAISQASRSIASAQAWIDMASGVISNASEIGMDTRDEIAALATSKGLLLNAKDYLQSAQAYISASDEAAKSDAGKASEYAKQAEEKARSAYESLNSKIETCRAAYRQLLSAQAEITDADSIYAKLASVVKGLPSEMNAGAAAQDVEAQRQKLDTAKNENSRARAQLEAGYCEQSLKGGISARDGAAEASNQLGRVAERMKDTIAAALDAASLRAQAKVDAAKDAYSSAGATFGANAAKIAQAQGHMINAQAALPSAQQAVDAAKRSTGLSDFLGKSAYALGALQEVGSEADKSVQLSQSAANDAYAAYAVVIAGVVCALGVGFLFWKRRRLGNAAGWLDKLGKGGKPGQVARKYASKGDYKKAAEIYAREGRFDKAGEMYRKLHKRGRG